MNLAVTERMKGAHHEVLHVSDVVLVGCQAVHERANQIVCGEVEHQAEGDGDGKRRQSLLENGQQEERQTQSLQNNRQLEIHPN